MLELNKDFFFRLPGSRRRAVLTGPHSVFCYSDYSSLTLVGDDVLIDNYAPYKLIQSPATGDYFALRVDGSPLGCSAYKVVNPIYSKKLKFICFAIPRVLDREIHATALAHDGFIRGKNIVINKSLQAACTFGEQTFKVNQIDEIEAFKDYKKFVVYADSEKERQLTWYNTVACANVAVMGYFLPKLRRDILVKELQWARKLFVRPTCSIPSALTQKEVIEQYDAFYPMRTVEFVAASEFPKWFEKTFKAPLLTVNPFPNEIKEAPDQPEFAESDAFIRGFI